MNAPDAIRFEGWTLQPATGELSRDGVAVRLQAQPCTLLVALLERPGQLVTREELIARLWPRGVVDFDTALNSAVRRLRTALGDHADQPRYIETIPKRGYRYIGTVARTSAGDSASAPAPAPAREVPTFVPERTRRLRGFAAAAIALLCATTAVVGASLLLDRPVATVRAEPSLADAAVTRAEFFLRRRGPGDFELAQRDFEAALRLDPQLAKAWAGLASVHWLSTMERGGETRPGFEATRAAAERALELDPTLAVPHLRLANYYHVTGNPARAREHLAAALERDPRNPLALSFAASEAASRGDFERAIAQERMAVEAEPLATATRNNLVAWLLFAGRPEEARSEWARLREISPGYRDADAMLGVALVLERRYEEALAAARPLPDGPARLQVEALAYHGLGRADESDAALRKMMVAAPGRDPLRVAEVYAYCGKPELAFAWLNAAADAYRESHCTRSDCVELGFARHSPLLKPLHGDDRWRAWVARVDPANGRAG